MTATQGATIGRRPSRAAEVSRWLPIALSREVAVVVASMAIALVAHGYNMFHYPSLSLNGDEGIYTAQAWAILELRSLSPYTYWYDHAPLGWLLLAAWRVFTSPLPGLENAIDAGRVFMLVVHVASVPLLYRVGRKLGCSVPFATLAVILFSVSPLAVFYQRLVLLDSIMVFFLLLSIDLLLDGWGRVSRFALSGAAFACAALSKEPAVFLGPPMLYLLWQQHRQRHGPFAVGAWFATATFGVSLYPLFAALKGELLPAAMAIRFALFNIESGARVSLIDSLRWQIERGGGGNVLDPASYVRSLVESWSVSDPLLVLGGIAAVAINLLRGFRDRKAMAIAVLGLFPVLYLLRGGVVFSFYIIFAIPFLALNLASLGTWLFSRLHVGVATGGAATIVAGAVALYLVQGSMQPLYAEQPDVAIREAVKWIKSTLPPDSYVIANDDVWLSLREETHLPGFPNVHSHWKVVSDPAVREGVFGDDWRTVDYLIMEPSLLEFFERTGNRIALDALANAHLVRRWVPPEGDGRFHPHSTVELWKVTKPGIVDTALPASVATSIERRFEQGGAFRGADGRVHASSQSAALLRAVWTDDRALFERTWDWTRAHLVGADGLLAAESTSRGPTTGAADLVETVDTALALILAGRRWDVGEYTAAGTDLVGRIWRQGVSEAGGRPYLAASTWGRDTPSVPWMPGAFAPYAYHVFAEVDGAHDWRELIDAGYDMLFRVSSEPFGEKRSAGLPPNAVAIDRASGAPRTEVVDGVDTSDYGSEAAPVYWRTAVHGAWTGDGRASAFLGLAGFLRDEFRRGQVEAAYSHAGEPRAEVGSAVGDAAVLSALMTLQPDVAEEAFARMFLGGVTTRGGETFWRDADDLQAQEWLWAASALRAGLVTLESP